MSIRPYKDKDGNYKIGVALSLCKYCGEPDGVVLGGKEVDKVGHRGAVFTDEPCAKCAEYMRQGIMICETIDGQDSKSIPCRTGRIVVIKEEAFRRIFKTHEPCELKRFYYMEQAAFKSVFDESL